MSLFVVVDGGGGGGADTNAAPTAVSFFLSPSLFYASPVMPSNVISFAPSSVRGISQRLGDINRSSFSPIEHHLLQTMYQSL
jgi:hypothetical protein